MLVVRSMGINKTGCLPSWGLPYDGAGGGNIGQMREWNNMVKKCKYSCRGFTSAGAIGARLNGKCVFELNHSEGVAL